MNATTPWGDGQRGGGGREVRTNWAARAPAGRAEAHGSGLGWSDVIQSKPDDAITGEKEEGSGLMGVGRATMTRRGKKGQCSRPVAKVSPHEGRGARA
ncbi:hypothetical protein NL676_030210 [Syzygium grande]|nr:hypothetical protein NL676_030210 [Syzygium grande]